MCSIINIWAVLISAVASMAIGSIWYGPLFGKIFMKAMGMESWTPEQQIKMKKAMAFTFLGQFIASLVMFYTVGWLMASLGKVSLPGGLITAFIVWIGFVVPLKLGDALWGGKMILFWLGIGNMFVTLAATGAILGAWK
jgi:hypothetical protein